MTATASRQVAEPLACQRHLFDVPDHVSYLDAAAWAPLPHAVRAVGEAGIISKSQPWAHSRADAAVWAERARTAAAGLIGARADDVAIVGSVSHAMATAARNLPVTPGGRLLRVAGEFPSLCYAWDRLAEERGLVVDIVPRPGDGDWTAALLQAISRPGAPPLAVATLTPLHWADGTIIDLERLSPVVRAAGGALVIDATQAVGAMVVDVAALRPDFLAFPTYKWLLGPYSLAFLYADPERQQGQPLEENNGNREPAAGARRYDRGECNDPVALPMAAVGMELVGHWGAPATAARLRVLTDALAEGAATMGLTAAPRALRSPHILALRKLGGLPSDLVDGLKTAGVFASERQGGLRLSPHVWANEADVARCLKALSAALS